jgi:phosphoesterase RecJ-like protein
MRDKIKRFLENHQHFLITTHIEPDGDAIGSELAMAIQLGMMKKKALILNPDPVPKRYRFLAGWEQIQVQKPPSNTIDAAIIMDVGSTKRTGWVFDYIKELRVDIMNIDHHVSNTAYGTVNYVESSASSTAECVYDIFTALDLPLNTSICECIATGIITDTGRFSFRNTTEKTFRICAELIRCGVNFYALNQKIYSNRSYASLRLLAMVLATIRITERIAFVNLTRQMLSDTGTKEEETEGFVNYVLAIGGIRAAVFFREKDAGETRVSLRAKDNSIDVNTIAMQFKGGGHAQAAGFRSRKNITELEGDILQAFRQFS